jgi:solute carrier family 1 (high affinity glutamate transporter) protein 2
MLLKKNIPFRDRIRTSINVLGDGYGAGIVYHLTKDELEAMDAERRGEQVKTSIHKADSQLILSDKSLYKTSNPTCSETIM